jgi:hypothetical protein
MLTNWFYYVLYIYCMFIYIYIYFFSFTVYFTGTGKWRNIITLYYTPVYTPLPSCPCISPLLKRTNSSVSPGLIIEGLRYILFSLFNNFNKIEYVKGKSKHVISNGFQPSAKNTDHSITLPSSISWYIFRRFIGLHVLLRDECFDLLLQL